MMRFCGCVFMMTFAPCSWVFQRNQLIQLGQFIVVGSVSLITFWLCIPHMFNEMPRQLLLQCLAFSALVAAWFDNRNMPSSQQEHGMIHFCFQSRFAKSALVDFPNPNAEKDPLHQRFFETQLLDTQQHDILQFLLQQTCFSKSSILVKPPHQLATPNPWPTFTNSAPDIALLTRHMSSPCRSWPWREATRHRCSRRCRWISSLSCPWDAPGGRSSLGAMVW